MRFSRILPFVAVFVHFSAWPVEIGEGWMRAMPPGQPTAAAYLTLRNPGESPAQLTGAHSSAAESVEIHQSSQEQGMWRMRKLAGLDIPPGAEVTMAPGGVHLMLFGLKRPLQAGDAISVVLEFDGGETREISIDVRALGSDSHQHHH